MRSIFIVLTLASFFGIGHGQSLFEYREVDLTGTVAGYRWHVDYPRLFNYCGFFPPRDALLVRLDSTPYSEGAKSEYVVVESPNRFKDGRLFANGPRKKFRVMRWVGCDQIVERWEMKLTLPFEKVKLPFRKLLPCYIAMKDIKK
ncbi:MAG TPA: hypothetical protein PLK77_12100 [Pyrinomonadaceae bacterium]|nr:hypothetical protein [Pyrinomonadaceae bacterium]